MCRPELVLIVSAIVLGFFFNEQKGSYAQSSSLCTESEVQADPCKCCKVSCWYNENTIFDAQHKRMPGSGGENEALDVLLQIKRCVREFCQLACTGSKTASRPTPKL